MPPYSNPAGPTTPSDTDEDQVTLRAGALPSWIAGRPWWQRPAVPSAGWFLIIGCALAVVAGEWLGSLVRPGP
ncbi:MAG: hypothetical protein ACYDAY_08875 [Candidatus Dormibacteria bacterium]